MPYFNFSNALKCFNIRTKFQVHIICSYRRKDGGIIFQISNFISMLNYTLVIKHMFTLQKYPNFGKLKSITIMSSRSSRRRCSVWKGVPRNFAKFTEKHLCQKLFFNKKETLAHVFPVNFSKFLRTPFLQSTSSGALIVAKKGTQSFNPIFALKS